MELCFETHSLSEDNERGVATGWLQGCLSPQGRLLAKMLGQRRADVSVIFVSDLARALETVEIAFESAKVPTFVDWRLRECDYGQLNGASAAVVRSMRADRLDHPYPGGESWRQATTRIAHFIEDLRGPLGSRWIGRRILVIGHVATKWGFDQALRGLELEQLVLSGLDWREGWDYQLDPQ
jgi:2,3-bisphosphoglycerate-dependent phosphoglycerate mutase